MTRFAINSLLSVLVALQLVDELATLYKYSSTWSSFTRSE